MILRSDGRIKYFCRWYKRKEKLMKRRKYLREEAQLGVTNENMKRADQYYINNARAFLPLLRKGTTLSRQFN